MACSGYKVYWQNERGSWESDLSVYEDAKKAALVAKHFAKHFAYPSPDNSPDNVSTDWVVVQLAYYDVPNKVAGVAQMRYFGRIVAHSWR